MNKFDLQSAKFLSIIIGICLIFVLVVWHAYSYLPESQDLVQNHTEVVLPSDTEEVKNESPQNQEESENETTDDDSEKVSNTDRDTKSFTENITDQSSIKEQTDKKEVEQLKPLEPIEEYPNSNELKQSYNMSFSDILNKANEYKLARNFNDAIEEYKKAISVTDVSADKAICYDNIAIIYAVSKRYGSAIIAAQKAYNLQPTIDRDFMIARLYYKTGKIEEAKNRILNILRKEFTL